MLKYLIIYKILKVVLIYIQLLKFKNNKEC